MIELAQLSVTRSFYRGIKGSECPKLPEYIRSSRDYRNGVVDYPRVAVG